MRRPCTFFLILFIYLSFLFEGWGGVELGVALHVCSHFGKTAPSAFIAEHGATWHAIVLGPVWVGCPGHVPSQALAHLSLFAGGAEWETESTLRQCKGRFSSSQSTGVLPALL